MASPQVLPNSSRKDHLEAGKKKLEEFRKQRKAKVGKKTETFTQNQPNQLPKSETDPKVDLNQSTTIFPNGPTLNNTETTDSTIFPNLILHRSSNGFYDNSAEKTAKTDSSDLQESSSFIPNMANGYHDDWREKSDANSSLKAEPLLSSSNFVRYTNNPEHEATNSNFFLTRNFPEVSSSSGSLNHTNQFDVSSSQVGFEYISNIVSKEEDKTSYSSTNPYSNLGFDLNRPNTSSTDFTSQQNPFLSNNSGIRSRPSFLDSIGINRVSATSHVTQEEPEKPSSLFSLNHSNVQDLNRKELSFGVEQELKYQNVTSCAKDEDFTALEQLIEDLTVEKFSLQRALDASKAIADSLTADNASLTEDYNRQGKVISQLKSDMEKLQDEINAQLLALETLRGEYMNAQLECSAADERANLLASEVITSEEKALRLRSNELKLEKQVESLNSEISSFKRRLSSFERERQDFQSTINALLEEQKLLHAKLRNTPTSENINKETPKAPESRTNASTSTDDLSELIDATRVNTMQEAVPAESQLQNNTSDISFSLEELDVALPSDQLRMINNIGALISELSVEREELMQALRIESSNCSRLKDLNKDLTQKLEAQTQRLELMAAERMASGSTITPNPSDSSHTLTDTSIYADEGDEVVERVLGWILKLFPGGPAKRRTSKLL